VSQKRSTFVLVNPSEILAALVGLKYVRVLRYEHNGPAVELMIEQVLGEVRCPSCSERAQVKERPVVRYVDLPVYGAPMRLHRSGQLPLKTASTHRSTCCARRPEVDAADLLLAEKGQKTHSQPRPATGINKGRRTAAR